MVPTFPKAAGLKSEKLVGIEADLDWGAAYLVESFRRPGVPLVWIWPEGQGDAVSIGNLLAEAVGQSLGPVLPLGAPWWSHLHLLQQHLEALSPMDLVLFNAQQVPELAGGLFSLLRKENRLLIQGKSLDRVIPGEAKRIREEDLRLSVAEVASLVPSLGEEEVEACVEATEGAFERVLLWLYQRGHIPPPTRPTPWGPRYLPGVGVEVNPEALLSLLLKQGRLGEALELAVHRLPHRLAEVLEKAGPHFRQRGEGEKLRSLLEQVRPPHRGAEVLFWLLRTTPISEARGKLAEEIRTLLEREEAPDLRALYAGNLLLPPKAYEEAERAYRAKATPFTARAYAQLTHSEEAARHALRLSYEGGHPYDTAMAAYTLGWILAGQGRFTEALAATEEALEVLRRSGAKVHEGSLRVLGLTALLQLLLGKPDPSTFQELEQTRALGDENTREAYAVSLMRYLWWKGDRQGATEGLRQLWEEGDWWVKVVVGPSLVHALLETGRKEEALRVGRRLALHKERLSPSHLGLYARIAEGMAWSGENPSRAREILEGVWAERESVGFARMRIWAKLYLLFYTAWVNPDPLGLLERERSLWRELAPEALGLFAPNGLVQRLQPQEALILRFLGHIEAVYRGQRLNLSTRQAEVLALLTLEPEGLTLEALAERLGLEDTGGVKSLVHHLRKQVPIASKPYRLLLPVKADFVELKEALAQGRLKDALRLYQGPLLPRSQSARIEEERAYLEEALRQAVLRAEDGDLAFELAQRLGDDLELWEKALTLLRTQDPRYPLARGYVEVLRKKYGI